KGMRIALAIALLLVLAAPAAADEPRGCDKFAWPLDAERAALTSVAKQTAPVGAMLDRTSSVAIEMPLRPFREARLAMPPERSPKKPDSFARTVQFGGGAAAGKYKVTLSDAGWIDIIQ